MTVISYIFSFLCSQDALRSFAMAGRFLPVCQRCTGLYIGMGISCIYLLVSGDYRKGVPARSIVYVNIASLLAMPVFGFGVLDPGAGWRLWSGLIYGNALVFLLVPATVVICSQGERFIRRADASLIGFWGLFAFLNSMPFWFGVEAAWFFYAVLVLMLVGLLCVVFCVAAVTVSLIRGFLISVVLKVERIR